MLAGLALPSASDLAAELLVLAQVVLIDLMLAGDNAVAVGLSASGLEPHKRRTAILAGLGAAVALRIAFALLATRLLAIIGLTFAGGLILLWVCWKMWRDLRAAHRPPANGSRAQPAKSFAGALLQIMAADLSMSLDNVLAVAGAARQHPMLLAFGLLLSIALTGLAASWVARVLGRVRWLGYAGLLVVIYVAFSMIWAGHRDAIMDLHLVRQYNAVAPRALEITPAELAQHRAGRHQGASLRR